MKVFIECIATRIDLDICDGNRLILFRGDRVRVIARPAVKAPFRGMYPVLDSWNRVIGYLGRRDIRRVTGKSVENLMETNNVTLATQR